MSKTKYSEHEKQKAYEFLKKFKGQTFAANITSVSRSGLSRRIKIFAPNFVNLSYYIAVLLDLHYNNKGIRVNGTGMDMIFYLLIRLNQKMAILDNNYNEECYSDYFTNANNYTYIGD